MAGIEEGISTVLAYAADDSHGYVLQGREYEYGTDCAGLVRLYAATVEGVDVGSYPDFHTWSEVATLTARGWTDMGFDYGSAVRGDVFLRALGDSTGHTVVYLGGGRIVGAEGNWDGRQGDSSGTEVCERAYYDYSYNHILRPPTVAGTSEEEDEEVTSEDISKIAHAVWNYYNAAMNGSSDAYQLHTDNHEMLTRSDVAGHDNPDGHNLYGRVQILEHNISLVMAALGIEDSYRSHVSGDPGPQLDDEVGAIGTALFSLSDGDVQRVAEAVIERMQGQEG